MCKRYRPNECFSGRGHARHLCKQCARRPRAQRDRIRALDDIRGFLEQSNISAKNITHLECLCTSTDQDVRELAALVLDVARVKPHARRRLRYLRVHRPDLLAQLVRYGLCDEWVEWETAQLECDDPFCKPF